MKAACNQGDLETRKNNITTKKRSGQSPFKSTVALGFLDKGDKEDLLTYAATLDDKGFKEMISIPQLEKEVRKNELLSIRADTVGSRRLSATKASPVRRSPSPVRRSPSPVRRSPSPVRAVRTVPSYKDARWTNKDFDGDFTTTDEMTANDTLYRRRSLSPVRRSPSPVRRSPVKSTHIPISDVVLTGNEKEDAKTLSAYSNEELKEVFNDSYVNKVIRSPTFTKQRSLHLSPIKTPSRLSPAKTPSRLSPAKTPARLSPTARKTPARTWVDESTSSEESEDLYAPSVCSMTRSRK
jgi:hypothetical protein